MFVCTDNLCFKTCVDPIAHTATVIGRIKRCGRALTCDDIIGSGPRKGEICGARVKDGQEACGRHIRQYDDTLFYAKIKVPNPLANAFRKLKIMSVNPYINKLDAVTQELIDERLFSPGDEDRVNPNNNVLYDVLRRLMDLKFNELTEGFMTCLGKEAKTRYYDTEYVLGQWTRRITDEIRTHSSYPIQLSGFPTKVYHALRDLRMSAETMYEGDSDSPPPSPKLKGYTLKTVRAAVAAIRIRDIGTDFVGDDTYSINNDCIVNVINPFGVPDFKPNLKVRKTMFEIEYANYKERMYAFNGRELTLNEDVRFKERARKELEMPPKPNTNIEPSSIELSIIKEMKDKWGINVTWNDLRKNEYTDPLYLRYHADLDGTDYGNVLRHKIYIHFKEK